MKSTARLKSRYFVHTNPDRNGKREPNTSGYHKSVINQVCPDKEQYCKQQKEKELVPSLGGRYARESANVFFRRCEAQFHARKYIANLRPVYVNPLVWSAMVGDK